MIKNELFLYFFCIFKLIYNKSYMETIKNISILNICLFVMLSFQLSKVRIVTKTRRACLFWLFIGGNVPAHF